MFFHRSMLLIPALVLAGAPVCGTVITYSDRSTWETALGGGAFDLITFDSLLGDYSNSTGLAVDGINILGLQSNGTSYDLIVGNLCPTYCWNSDPVAYQQFGRGTLVITVPTSVRGVGMNLMTIAGGYTLTVDVSAGGGYEYYVTTLTPPNMAFFGIRADSAITSIQVTAPAGARLTVDNIESAGPSQTAEVATLLLIGGGLITLRLLRRLVPTR